MLHRVFPWVLVLIGVCWGEAWEPTAMLQVGRRNVMQSEADVAVSTWSPGDVQAVALYQATLQILRDGATPDVIRFVNESLMSFESTILPALVHSHETDQEMVTKQVQQFFVVIEAHERRVEASETLYDFSEAKEKYFACRASHAESCAEAMGCHDSLQSVRQKAEVQRALHSEASQAVHATTCAIGANDTNGGSVEHNAGLYSRYIETGRAAFAARRDLLSHAESCLDYNASMQRTFANCHDNQANLEQRYCMAMVLHADDVLNLAEEWQTALDSLARMRASVEKQEERRSHEYRALLEVKCILITIYERGGRACDETEDGLVDSTVATCHAKASSPNFTIQYPALPPKPWALAEPAPPCSDTELASELERRSPQASGTCFGEGHRCFHPQCGVREMATCTPPESAKYQLISEVNIPSKSENWDTGEHVPYVFRNAPPKYIGRVAYCLVLNGSWVWTSFDHNELDNVGVPADYVLDKDLANLHVFSNVEGVVSQEEGGGFVEFWDNCYVRGETKSYNHEDMRSAGDCYGSMQVHGASTATLWAFNGWSHPGGCDVQLGSAMNRYGSLDGTYNQNCDMYVGNGFLRTYTLEAAVPQSICAPTEAQSFKLAYELNIPGMESNWDIQHHVPYTQMRTNIGRVSRVAYCLELDGRWAWTSFDNTDFAKIAVPTDYVADGPVQHLNVFSNDPAIQEQQGVQGGIEFWDHCYERGDGRAYGAADIRTLSNCYGSMQVHGPGETTIWAFNGWSHRGSCDVQLGGSANHLGHADGTANANCADYQDGRGKLRIYVM